MSAPSFASRDARVITASACSSPPASRKRPSGSLFRISESFVGRVQLDECSGLGMAGGGRRFTAIPRTFAKRTSRSLGATPTALRREDSFRRVEMHRTTSRRWAIRPARNRRALLAARARDLSHVTPCREIRAQRRWSVYGAKRAQPVATGRKLDGAENGPNKPIGNRWQSTATVPDRMVRRGSTVRVRQRASCFSLPRQRCGCQRW